MIFDFDGTKVQGDVSDEQTSVSKHTGRPLSQLTLSVEVRGRNMSDRLLSLIKQGKKDGIASLDKDGNPEKRWKIGNTSWRYQDGFPIYTHTLGLEEVEQLRATVLMLDDLQVIPYEYEERFDDDALVVEAKVRLSEDQHLRMKALLRQEEGIVVVREGVSDEPRRMMPGLCYWSQHETEYKYELYLHDPMDVSPLARTFAWMRSMRKTVANNTAALHSLVSLLVSKGVISSDEAPTMGDEITDDAWEVMFGFFQVDDVDDVDD